MRKSATYKKNADRLRNELRNRNASNSSNGIENQITSDKGDEERPPGLKGREIGLWYAQRNKRRKEQDLAGGVEGERRIKMVGQFFVFSFLF